MNLIISLHELTTISHAGDASPPDDELRNARERAKGSEYRVLDFYDCYFRIYNEIGLETESSNELY